MSTSKKVQMYLMHEDDEGLSLRLPNRWLNVWAAYNEADALVWHLHAGYEALPADYKEEHDSLDSLVASMRSVRDLRSWQPSSIYYRED